MDPSWGDRRLPHRPAPRGGSLCRLSLPLDRGSDHESGAPGSAPLGAPHLGDQQRHERHRAVITVTACGFARAIATRHARPGLPVGRVPAVLLSRRPSTICQTTLCAGTPVQLSVALRAVYQRTTWVDRQRVLIQRQETRMARLLDVVRTVVERTRRVEPSAPGGVRGSAAPDASPVALATEPPRPIVPAVARVVRTTPAPSARDDTARPMPAAVSPTAQVASGMLSTRELARVTEEVMRGIDRRIAAHRERRGRC